jgi:chromosome segregation protein
MYLKRLEIHGFKSFAQKTTLEFTQGIIAVVGPNGSGKSNVADAIRWVLGEQSPKIIRGKKSDDMIFAGSDKKIRLGFAEVFATFDNRDHRIPLDAAEVSIGRRIDRSGESEYLLNGNRVRLLDVIDLVLRSNIGTSRYTVIGQGTIDNMILQGPSEIKNLVDEASGVKTYYIKRDRTLRRLEQTAQNLMRAEDLIAEIEPRLKSLRRQARKMEARTEIEAELKTYQQQFFGSAFWNLKKALAEVLGRLAAVEETQHGLEKEIATERQKLEGLESGGQTDGALYKSIQEKLKVLQDKKNKLLEDLSLVRGKMQSQKTSGGDPKTLQVEIHEKSRQIAETGDKLREANLSQQSLGKNLEAQSGGLKSLTEKLNQLYSCSKNPAQIDWALFDLEIKSLETAWERFYAGLQSAGDLQSARAEAGQLKLVFEKFRSIVKGIVRDPQGQLAEFQQELQRVLPLKEQLDAEVRKLDLDLARSKMNSDFLVKQLAQFEQEKLHLDLELKKAQSHSFDDFIKELIVQEERIKKELETLGQEIGMVEADLKKYYQEEEGRRKDIRLAENEFRNKQDHLSKIKDQASGISIEKAKLDTQMQVLAEEVARILGNTAILEFDKQEIVGGDSALGEKILKLKNQLEMIGGMDELTLKEYKETEARHANLSTQVEDLKKGMADLRGIMDELDEHIKKKFDESFHKINEKFEFYFRVLFNGGRAYLSVMKAEPSFAEASEGKEQEVDNNDDHEPQEQLRPEEKVLQKYSQPSSNIVGIDIKATPPGKKLAAIQALSGGERALTSIALLCSLLACFPSPFVVLDEVDAALDEANTIRFGQILATLANQTQFITITHNRETMAQSTMLYGVTMGDDGVSKLLSIKIDQATQYAK